jgi:hypothetical protein
MRLLSLLGGEGDMQMNEGGRLQDGFRRFSLALGGSRQYKTRTVGVENSKMMNPLSF